jgi:hypothetical protein
MKKAIRIEVCNPITGALKKIKWRGWIVGGSDRTLAVTRPAKFMGFKVVPADSGWTVTHLPTGVKADVLGDPKFKRALRNAKAFYKILAKHKVQHSKDRFFIAATVRADVHKRFGLPV